MQKQQRNTGRIVVLLAAIIVMATLCGPATAESYTNHARTQVLAYIVGSDLETNDAMATEDLREIANSLENADPANLDIVVAFGGANKEGWRGMRIATGEQLKQDAVDGVFGNHQYLYTDTSADMGRGSTLAKFLTETKASRTSDRTILIIADHGNSYDGIGNDDITGNQLKMGDIDSALRGSGIRYEPIMFDACLMASVEVGKTIQPYTGIMLGSEEIQRGSYEYANLIQPLLENPDTDARTIMRRIADAYIGDKSDGKSTGKVKTMAIIDVSRIPAIREGLDELGGKLLPVVETDQGLHDIKSAYNDAVRLGITDGGKPTSVDLVSLLENIAVKRPELASDMQQTIGVVKSAVVYERHNEYSPVVHGISIATPDAMDPAQYHAYGEAVKVAPRWDAFFQKMVEASQAGGSSSTSAAPASVAENRAASAAEDDDDETYQPPSKVKNDLGKKKGSLKTLRFISRGNGSYELDDPYHDASVYTTYYLINGTHALSIGSVPARSGSDGMYRIPEWDGRWYYFPGATAPRGSIWDTVMRFFGSGTTPDQPFFVDMEYDDITSGGFDEYNSWILMQEAEDSTEATLVTYVNTSRKTIETTVIPYSTTKDGGELFNRGMDHFENGSVLTSYTTGFNLKTGAPGEFILSRTRARPEMSIQNSLLPDGTYATGLMAYYDNDHEIMADQFRIITIKNGILTGSTWGSLR